MIKSDIGAAIKWTIGKNYGKKVLEYFRKEGIKKPSGKPYTRTEIYHAVNGLREYDQLESAIIDAAEYYKALNKAEAERRQQLLK